MFIVPLLFTIYAPAPSAYIPTELLFTVIVPSFLPLAPPVRYIPADESPSVIIPRFVPSSVTVCPPDPDTVCPGIGIPACCPLSTIPETFVPDELMFEVIPNKATVPTPFISEPFEPKAADVLL